MLVLSPSEITREKAYRIMKRQSIREKKKIREEIHLISKEELRRYEEEEAWLEYEDEVDRFTLVQDIITTQSSKMCCALCSSAVEEEYGPLLGPFLSRTSESNSNPLEGFYVHEACARYTPEVCCENKNVIQNEAVAPIKIDAREKDTVWYNIAEAVKRGRGIVSNVPNVKPPGNIYFKPVTHIRVYV